MPPPARSSAKIRLSGRNDALNANVAWIWWTVPSSPSRTSCAISLVCGRQRYMYASMKKTSLRTAASIIASAHARLIASGFSHSTCLPASAALIAHSTCIGCGVAIYTASTFSSASRSSYEPCRFAMSHLSAKALAESIDRLPTATTSLVGDVGTWLANREAMFPVPMMPQRSLLSVKRCPRCGLSVGSELQSEFHGAGGQVGDERTRADQEHADQGDDTHQGAGHHHRVVGAVDAVQLVEGDLQSEAVGVGHHDQRPQVIVPDVDEREDPEEGQAGPQHRQADGEVLPEEPGAVDLGGRDQFVGDRAAGVLAHPEDSERVRGTRDDERLQRADPAELGECDELRHEGQLGRDHEGREQYAEQHVPPGEVVLRECERR